MKKYLLLFILSFAANTFSGGFADKIKSALGFSDDKTAQSKDGRVDTVAFWKKTVELFDASGFDANSEFGKHARANLHRVETAHERRAKGIATLASMPGLGYRGKGSALARQGEQAESAKAIGKKQKKSKTAAERSAFKAGQAHQRYLAKKKVQKRVAKKTKQAKK